MTLPALPQGIVWGIECPVWVPFLLALKAKEIKRQLGSHLRISQVLKNHKEGPFSPPQPGLVLNFKMNMGLFVTATLFSLVISPLTPD